MNYCGLSDQGKVRLNNQDSFVVLENSGNILALVCDGIGGAKDGDWASSLVTDCLGDSFMKTEKLTTIDEAKAWFVKQVGIANRQIYNRSLTERENRGMGTTLVGVLIMDQIVLAVNCGDSRLYRMKDNVLRQVSNDHSLVYDMVRRGELSKKEAECHPGRHILSRAIGVDAKAKCDFFELPLNSDYLLLCSDGLTGLVPDRIIKKVLRKTASVEEKLAEMVEIANNNGGYDNITVVLLER